MALVLLDNGSSVIISVEGVHENERDVDIVGAVEVFDLSDGKIEEGHAVSDLNDGLGTNTAHGSTKTTIELDDCELVEEVDCITVGKLVVADDLLGRRRVDLGPVDGVALRLVVQISSEECEEVVHFRLESLLLCGVFDCVGKLVEGIAHLAGCDIGGGVLKSLASSSLGQRCFIHIVCGGNYSGEAVLVLRFRRRSRIEVHEVSGM